jgi:hypothetical protein
MPCDSSGSEDDCGEGREEYKFANYFVNAEANLSGRRRAMKYIHLY